VSLFGEGAPEKACSPGGIPSNGDFRALPVGGTLELQLNLLCKDHSSVSRESESPIRPEKGLQWPTLQPIWLPTRSASGFTANTPLAFVDQYIGNLKHSFEIWPAATPASQRHVPIA
jgi:hypothetical protein